MYCMLSSATPDVRPQMGDAAYTASKYPLAARLFARTTTGGPYSDFLTTLCYDHIVSPPTARM